MKLNILLFGITKDVIGASRLAFEVPEETTVPVLMERLRERYPAFREMASLMVAVNNEYGQKNQTLHESDEIALIPPVSGG